MIDVNKIMEQEERLQFEKFDNETAWEIGCMLVEMARERKHAVAIDITRCRQQLFHAAMPGSAVDNDCWLRRKVNTVYNFGYSSLIVEAQVKESGESLMESRGLPNDQYAASGGAFPVKIKGVGMVGSIAVSGLPSECDHGLIVECLEKYLNK